MQIDNYVDFAGIEIVPSTATKEDGSQYSLIHSYEPENDDIATIDTEKNSITFKQPGIVWIRSNIEGKHEITTQLKSTYGTLGKFNLYRDENKVISNTTIEYANAPLVFSVFNLSRSEAQQITAEAFSSTELFDIKKEIISETLFGTIKEVRFTITPKTTDISGTEIVIFKTKTYNIYVNLKINPQITDIKLSYNNEELKTDNISYTNNLTINALPLPITTIGDKTKFPFTIELDGTEQTISADNKITLSNLTKGVVHKLTAKWTKDGQPTSKVWNIDVKSNYDDLKVTLSGADKDNNLYLESNQIQKTMYLKANGFVTKDFFVSEKFTAEISRGTSEFVLDTLTVTVPSPDQAPNYSETLTLKYDGKVIEGCSYKLTRDIVSRIKLPNHNNEDMTDKKGMQKVHVYGNHSFYPETGYADYYALPIDLYNYKYEKIEDADAKKAAFDSLDYSFNDGSTLEYKDGKLCIKFDSKSLYSYEEIANNAFDSKTNKNVTFTINTKTNAANAKYTFVATTGLNVYNQEGIHFSRWDSRSNYILVLQNNFGTETGTKFDDTTVCDMGGVIGNGYTLHCKKILGEPSKTECRAVMIIFAINATISGFDDADCNWDVANNVIINICSDVLKGPYLFRYNILKNFLNIMSLSNAVGDITCKNNIFFNSLLGAMSTNGNPVKGNVYIEDCTFFNTGCFTFWSGLNDPSGVANFYFKGEQRLYNFHNKEMLQHFFGFDASPYAWDLIVGIARQKNMLQMGADGRPYINSYMIGWLNSGIYFWNGTEYVKSDKGFEQSGVYLSKLVNIRLPFIQNIEFNIWSTTSPDVFPNSPNYYDEYDKDGNLRIDFLNKQIEINSREIHYF